MEENTFIILPAYILGEAVGLSSMFFLREKNLPNGDLERERFPSGVPSFGKVLPDLEIKLVYYQTQSPVKQLNIVSNKAADNTVVRSSIID